MTRDTMQQQVYIRVCRDSGFGLDVFRATRLAADALDCSPIELCVAFGSIETMTEIAAGTHPAANEEQGK